MVLEPFNIGRLELVLNLLGIGRNSLVGLALFLETH